MKKIKRRKDEGSFIKRYINSFKHALDGINYAIENEHNMIGIMIYVILILVLAILLPINSVEILVIVLTVGLTIVTEMFNSSIEAGIDLITTKENELAKISKDCANSAAFIMTITSVIINLIIFVPKIIEFFEGLI